jgi:prevent-host-death family protein
MAEISVRRLRNDVSEVLRRVEAGERFRVTVNRRPVADLIPLSDRRGSVPWGEVRTALDRVQADALLARELREAVPDTTDDI